MSIRKLAGAWLVLCLLTRTFPASAADDATMFRVFLKDGRSLVSYGELARVGDRVVFSLPTSSGRNPSLRLVDIPAEQVDWDRTERYAVTARSGRYLETQAEIDYTELSNQITQTLNAVGEATDTDQRLALVQQARKALADWPLSHYNYRETDIRQLLTLLDQAIADLRLAIGARARFDLNLVAVSSPPPVVEPLLPAPTQRELIEQTITAAHLAQSPTDRVSLLTVAAKELERADSGLPAAWAASTGVAIRREIATEARVDRSYQALTRRMTSLADQRARSADVLGVERVLTRIARRDEWLGGVRPDAVNALVATVEERLDAARRLRLARDRWALRAPELTTYREAISRPLDLFAQLRPALEDIKSLAGSSPSTLERLDRLIAWILQRSSQISPPEELTAAHALFVSAVHMAENAAIIRREATLANSVERAWDASSAAAGALMLSARARSDMRAQLRRPQLQLP
jgi:hypothetical protein